MNHVREQSVQMMTHGLDDGGGRNPLLKNVGYTGLRLGNHEIENDFTSNFRAGARRQISRPKIFRNKIPDDIKTFEVKDEIRNDIENISEGIFSPIEGFLCKADFDSVVREGRLSNQIPWTIPIILDVNYIHRGDE